MQKKMAEDVSKKLSTLTQKLEANQVSAEVCAQVTISSVSCFAFVVSLRVYHPSCRENETANRIFEAPQRMIQYRMFFHHQVHHSTYQSRTFRTQIPRAIKELLT
jgi:hypothetical protein